MKTWHVLLIVGGVGFYLYKREEMSIEIAANRGATGAVDAAGRGTVKVIDEAFGALGRWFSGLGSGGANTSGSGNSAAYTPDGYDSYEDYYDFGDV